MEQIKKRYYSRIERVIQNSFARLFMVLAVIALFSSVVFNAPHQLIMFGVCVIMAWVLKTENRRTWKPK